MSKRTVHLSAKVAPEDKLAIEAKARAEGKTVSGMLRDFARGASASHAGVAPAAQPETLQVHHVDELGADPWRRDNGALQR